MDVRVVRCVGRGLCDLSRRALRSPFRVWHSAELCGWPYPYLHLDHCWEFVFILRPSFGFLRRVVCLFRRFEKTRWLPLLKLVLNVHHIRVIKGFSREVDENCALWNITQVVVVIPCRRFETTYRSQYQGSRILLPICRGQESLLTLEDGTDSLSRGVCKELPLYAASYPRRAQFSSNCSVWPHGARHGSAAARLLGSRVWISLKAWKLISCVCCMVLVAVSATSWSLIHDSPTGYVCLCGL